MKKLLQGVLSAILFFTSSSIAFAQKGATEEIRKQIDTAVKLKVGTATGPDIKIGTILSALLPYLYVAGGFILFIMMIWGGFEMLTGATEQKSQEAGKQRITTAVIGFILLFVSYWIAQILQIIFGIRIL